MRKIILIIVTLSVLVFVSSKTSFAVAKRYMTCDACGFCPVVVNDPVASSCTPTKPDPNDPTKTINLWPGDWKKCVKCLYPDKYPDMSNPNPANCDTLLINNMTNSPKYSVKAGRQFTMLGCITSGASVGFDNKDGGIGGAPSFVQAVLNVIFTLSGGLAFLYLMYGGFTILTSQADPEKLNYGRRLVMGAIVGLIFTIGSVFLVNLIGSGILHIPGFGGTTP